MAVFTRDRNQIHLRIRQIEEDIGELQRLVESSRERQPLENRTTSTIEELNTLRTELQRRNREIRRQIESLSVELRRATHVTTKKDLAGIDRFFSRWRIHENEICYKKTVKKLVLEIKVLFCHLSLLFSFARLYIQRIE